MPEMPDILEGGRRKHYLELALQVRTFAREARFPAARRALMEIAKRFERGARAKKTRISPTTVDNPVYNLEQRLRIPTVPTA
jgi:hypothetical protein